MQNRPVKLSHLPFTWSKQSEKPKQRSSGEMYLPLPGVGQAPSSDSQAGREDAGGTGGSLSTLPGPGSGPAQPKDQACCSCCMKTTARSSPAVTHTPTLRSRLLCVVVYSLKDCCGFAKKMPFHLPAPPARRRRFCLPGFPVLPGPSQCTAGLHLRALKSKCCLSALPTGRKVHLTL